MSGFLFVKQISKIKSGSQYNNLLLQEPFCNVKSTFISASMQKEIKNTTVIYIDDKNYNKGNMVVLDPETGLPIWEMPFDLKEKN
jgi:outer membrane protein assembly factor BamB